MVAIKRLIRVLGVLAVNGFVVCMTAGRLSGPLLGSDPWDFQIWVESVLEILLPAIGFLLEVFHWKFAKWVNIGYLSASGFLWLAGAAWWWRNVWFGVFVTISLVMFILAGLTEVLYRRTATVDEVRQPAA